MKSCQQKIRLAAILLPLAWFVWKHLQLMSFFYQHDTTVTVRTDHLPLPLSPPPSSPSRYAYASLIGGIDPDHPSYKGFFYNVLVAARLLRHYGSKADFVLLVQLSHTTTLQELSHKDQRLLHACQIHVVYLPKSRYQGFYDITLEKFRILQLIQYRRVLFMDADVMPLHNLDYLFEMTDQGRDGMLKENLVVAGTNEPSTAGFFVLAPGPDKWQQLQQVIQTREQQAQNSTTLNKFDIVQGWGHAIQPPDQWETLIQDKTGTKWTFYSADADQGLLYEWVKYHEQRVSIVLGSQVQNWIPGNNSNNNNYPILETVLHRPFHHQNLARFSNQTQQQQQQQHRRVAKWAKGPPPYCHFYHFTGRTKPWENPPPPPLGMDVDMEKKNNNHHMSSPERFWFYHLDQLNQELGLFDDWELERIKISKPPLGRFHVKADIAQRVDRTNKNNNNKT